jgi:dolichyl-phosphate beta-glucosyltransferase
VTRVRVVVPCFNEAGRLPVARFESGLAELADVELVFVDDGSTDGTVATLEALRAAAPDRVRVLRLPRNVGKGEAVRAGMLDALERGAQYVGYWDADLATPLTAIRTFREVLEAHPGLEMVFGARVQLLGRSIRRRALRHYLGRVFATVVSVMLRLAIYDTQCGAKLFRVTASLPDLFREPFLTRWVFDVEIIARLIRARRGSNQPPVEAVIYEYPLDTWVDVPGSKVRGLDFVRALGGALRIYRHYLAPRAWTARRPA